MVVDLDLCEFRLRTGCIARPCVHRGFGGWSVTEKTKSVLRLGDEDACRTSTPCHDSPKRLAHCHTEIRRGSWPDKNLAGGRGRPSTQVSVPVREVKALDIDPIATDAKP